MLNFLWRMELIPLHCSMGFNYIQDQKFRFLTVHASGDGLYYWLRQKKWTVRMVQMMQLDSLYMHHIYIFAYPQGKAFFFGIKGKLFNLQGHICPCQEEAVCMVWVHFHLNCNRNLTFIRTIKM
ncbi:hypothetical protein AAZX31_16G067900 [Glycine max]|uniref:Uncharacterized protein n=2 Tax=Glycine subgen. Soja TaxID=1462606 RepID=K7MFP7_SOYBN|nr:hypothetical protein JHK86_044630 [Glycine max]KAG4940601.1 hypothetical protein JHK87_044472 [Glycine soja]KAG4951372.1 hypothetical protein JHK85_045239 [Glycine max]KAG5099228.1 hypothetical protein JHK82_044280 [Glycine max]KAG5107834.1 hypothetical protein JHK84_044741 [Glycine max]